MADYLSFKEFLEVAPATSVQGATLDETSKAGQPVAPPKRPRSPKALVNVPHKRVKGPKKPTGQPIPPPSAEMTTPKKIKEEKKPEKAVAIVIPQKSSLKKFLGNFRATGKSSAHKGGYAHARRGSISAPARRNSPKNFWGKKLEN